MKQIIKELLKVQINSFQEQIDILDIECIKLNTFEEVQFYLKHKLDLITALNNTENHLELLDKEEKENEEKKSE